MWILSEKFVARKSVRRLPSRKNKQGTRQTKNSKTMSKPNEKSARKLIKKNCASRKKPRKQKRG